MSHHQQPSEVRDTQYLHSDLIVASHAAVELAMDRTRRPASQRLESRYWATVGHIVSWELHNELETRLHGAVDWFKDRGFLAMVPRGQNVAIRLGRCDTNGRPSDTTDRDTGTPYRAFLDGLPVLFEDSPLRPVFGGYCLRRFSLDRQEQLEVDRFVLAKFSGQEHDWSWGLDPAERGEVRSVLDGKARRVEVVPTFIDVPRQRRMG